MLMRRPALALAALIVGLTALRQLARKPIGFGRAQGENGDGRAGLAQDEAAQAVGAKLKLEGFAGRCVVLGPDEILLGTTVVSHRTRPLAVPAVSPDGASWIVAHTVPRRPADG